MTDKSEINIIAVGDIMLGMAYPQSIANDDNIPVRLQNDSKALIDQKVENIFKKGDIVFGNLECVISKSFYDYGKKKITGCPNLIMAPPEATVFLKKYFTHLNIANNHMLDHGIDKAKETVRYLEKEKLPYIGKPMFWESNLTTVTIKNKTIGFLGYSLFVPDKERGKSLIQYRTTREFLGVKDKIPKKKELQDKILKKVKKSKGKINILIVSLHWGVPQTVFPSEDQIKFGRKLIDEGADIILAHGPHIFQPVERYKGKLIAYSMGNFIFDMWTEKTLNSGILDIVINDDNKIDVSIIPTTQRNYQVSVDKNKTKIKNMILDDINEGYDIEKHEKENKKIRRNHYKGFVWQYVTNSYKLPLCYHKDLIVDSASKIFNKIFSLK